MTLLRLSLLALLAAQSASFIRQTANRNKGVASSRRAVRMAAPFDVNAFTSSLLLSDNAEAAKPAVEAAVSVYSKVDKTGAPLHLFV